MSSFRAAPPRKSGVGVSLVSSEALAARMEDLERKVERLRALHESFFLGVERRAISRRPIAASPRAENP
jgi:hypothetical protein